ncbi:hydroxyisourate hydrolase [Pseudoclavibacter chungangensis]|uniref:5-hydroxyisourate hydrolase n=1 Tax=Pseudoclavibacter chungangensis TaxID=587635 RepID=A0A7J5BRA2_9MICO|nr:hydroxyisourate hydrolase [Pseudoclavibacter chungangensis]KAB1656744.1 hydroxyisourate hydrolase [Pseudoclavibacter chungangensis]NYJ67796.1 5-hydroxyisourate hydrolase [Pseudoclavibacter chungangensis]
MSHVTTHILDAALGRPAADVAIVLETSSGERIVSARTDADGRVKDLGPDRLEAGDYRLRFEVAEYFARTGTDTFYPVVTIDFTIADVEQHYHVPLLISPFAFSTYRGS